MPYQDPGANWYYRTYMDEGEFGFGLLASPLALGLDVPENAVLLDGSSSPRMPDPTRAGGAAAAAARGRRLRAPDRQPGVAPLRAVRGGRYEGRAEVELVVRSISQVGNYDYLIDWIFTQNGAIRVEVGLTGIDAPKAVGRATRFGEHGVRHSAPVAPQLVAPYHSHHFSFRLDLDIDGPTTASCSATEADAAPGPRRACGRSTSRRDRQRSARAAWTTSHAHVEAWSTPIAATRSASRPATWSRSHDYDEPLLDEDDYQRAGFIAHPLWITAHDRDERYAAGDTPNQNPGAPGLPQFVGNHERLVNRDLVLWLTLGHHHVTQAEDWPVMSTKKMCFELKPSNFFDRNPALDLRRAPFEVRR